VLAVRAKWRLRVWPVQVVWLLQQLLLLPMLPSQHGTCVLLVVMTAGRGVALVPTVRGGGARPRAASFNRLAVAMYW
jgi:hypothetical protein